MRLQFKYYLLTERRNITYIAADVSEKYYSNGSYSYNNYFLHSSSA